jgi:hypothetical protein
LARGDTEWPLNEAQRPQALVVNRNDTTLMTEQTTQMLDAMSDMLGRLGLMRQRLTQSFTEKKYAQLIDETCLRMKPEQV